MEQRSSFEQMMLEKKKSHVHAKKKEERSQAKTFHLHETELK